MFLPFSPLFDRHPIGAGVASVLGLLGADVLASLNAADAVLTLAVRLVTLAVAVVTLAHSLRKLRKG
jgi:hypothetical protein